jgi:hypothetical protein
MPIYTIIINAGMAGAIMVGKFLEQTNMDIGSNDTKAILFLFSCN